MRKHLVTILALAAAVLAACTENEVDVPDATSAILFVIRDAAPRAVPGGLRAVVESDLDGKADIGRVAEELGLPLVPGDAPLEQGETGRVRVTAIEWTDGSGVVVEVDFERRVPLHYVHGRRYRLEPDGNGSWRVLESSVTWES